MSKASSEVNWYCVFPQELYELLTMQAAQQSKGLVSNLYLDVETVESGGYWYNQLSWGLCKSQGCKKNVELPFNFRSSIYLGKYLLKL